MINANPCIFVDETGTSRDDPVFGVGLLKVYDTYSISQALQAPHNRARSLLAAKRRELQKKITKEGRHIAPEELNLMMRSTKHTEFHFSEIHHKNLQNYLDLLKTIQSFDFHFCALIVNKKLPDFNESIYRNPWDYYVSLVKLLVEKNVSENENAFLIADHMNKPRISEKHLDKELLSLNNRIGNVQMVDSVGVSLIQLCDIFLGAVAFAQRLNMGFIRESNNTTARKEFVKELCHTINIDNIKELTKNITKKDNGKYFSIWNLKLTHQEHGYPHSDSMPKP